LHRTHEALVARFVEVVGHELFASQSAVHVVVTARNDASREIAEAARRSGAVVRITTRSVAVQDERHGAVVERFLAATGATDPVIVSTPGSTEYCDVAADRSTAHRCAQLEERLRRLFRVDGQTPSALPDGSTLIRAGWMQFVEFAASIPHDEVERGAITLALEIDGGLTRAGVL
jgi:hypothetical protein